MHIHLIKWLLKHANPDVVDKENAGVRDKLIEISGEKQKIQFLTTLKWLAIIWD